MKKSKYENLESRIEEYFLHCDAVNEQKKKLCKPYTVSGFLYYTGLSRKELERLVGTRRYRDTLCSAMARIEAFIEENALSGSLSCNASLNSLKYYFGWGGEKSDRKSEGDGTNITVTLSPEMTELAR